jgi:CheY-like chemotaxis protein
MASRRVLVIEDDPAIRRAVLDALSYDGYQPAQASTFAQAREAALRFPCDLVLLDLVLPGGDGLDLLRDLRLAKPTLPVIILTARGEEQDRVKGLRLGADDYVVKPFGVGELLARVAAVLRRSAERPSDVGQVRFGGGVADLAPRGGSTGWRPGAPAVREGVRAAGLPGQARGPGGVTGRAARAGVAPAGPPESHPDHGHDGGAAAREAGRRRRRAPRGADGAGQGLPVPGRRRVMA